MPSPFLDAEAAPGARDLARVLGKRAALWWELVDGLVAAHPPLAPAWSWSGKSHGWILRLARRGKALVYLVPGEDGFAASFALRPAAHEAALAREWPATVLAALRGARQFREGRHIRIEVRKASDLAAVRTLVALQCGE
jgi:hypothetical protein